MQDFTGPRDGRGGAGAKSDRGHASWLLPVLAAEATISSELDAKLSVVAAVARDGNLAARDALFAALQPKLRRSVLRCYRWSRELSPAWDLDDLDQESFLIFVSLLTKWPGDDSFSAYFFSRVPYRLNDTVRRASGFRPISPPPTAGRPSQSDPDALDEPALAILASLAVKLPPPQAELLLLHVRDHLSFREIARRQGRHQLTIRRRWQSLQPTLRQLLAEHDAT